MVIHHLEHATMADTRTTLPHTQRNGTWEASKIKLNVVREMKRQWRIALPLMPMNGTWVVKIAITTAFLGRLGSLQLAAGTLGFTFANVTGFSVITGLCRGMEPICGQAHGARNHRVLRRAVFMGTTLLLAASIPISVLWLFVEKIFLVLGQQPDIARLSGSYVRYLIIDLITFAFLYPVRNFLSSQGSTFPILVSSVVALGCHIPFNIVLSKTKGVDGIAIAIGLTDVVALITLSAYVVATEVKRKVDMDGIAANTWRSDWARLLKYALQCCVTGCLMWWYYEIIILLAGRLPNPQQAVSVLSLIINFDYILSTVVMSLATSACTRVANELGAGNTRAARNAAHVSLGFSLLAGCLGGLAIIVAKKNWGALFTHEKGVVRKVSSMLPFMAVAEVFAFPLALCEGIIRGTSKPWMGMFTAVSAYTAGLPLAVVLAFKAGIGVSGLLIGLAASNALGAALLTAIVLWRVRWDEETREAHTGAIKVEEEHQIVTPL